jgi:PAS domain S-box-containing protein
LHLRTGVGVASAFCERLFFLFNALRGCFGQGRGWRNPCSCWFDAHFYRFSITGPYDMTQQPPNYSAFAQTFAEQQLMFDSDAFSVLVAFGGIIGRCNRALERLLGYGPGELIGMPVAACVPLALAGLQDAIAAEFSHAGKTVDGEVPVTRKDGSVLWLPATAYAVCAAAGAVVTVWTFQEAVPARTGHAVPLERELQHAVAEDRFTLAYQPIIDAECGTIASVEALLRLSLPCGRRVSPAEFVPLAEQSGLIVTLGMSVLREACRQVSAWQDATGVSMPVCVNLSACQLAVPGIADSLLAVIRDAGIDPSLIDLEVTETALMRNIDDGAAILRRLADGGVRLSIDDFGTGYSSLNYLYKLPVHTIKIDRTFIRDIEHDASGVTVVRAIIDLAAQLGLEIVAEGVETVGQFAILKELGCTRCQGFHFSRPVAPDHIEALLMQHDILPALSTRKCQFRENTWRRIPR